MNKGVSLLSCLALLLTMSPLTYAGEGGRVSTNEAMLSSASDPGWLSAPDVVGVTRYLEDNLRRLERENPALAQQYHRVGRAGHDTITEKCHDLRTPGIVHVKHQQPVYRVCEHSYRYHLETALGMQHPKYTNYLPDFQQDTYFPEPQHARTLANGASNAARSAALSSGGVVLENGDPFVAPVGPTTHLAVSEQQLVDDLASIGTLEELNGRMNQVANSFLFGKLSEVGLRAAMDIYADKLVSFHGELASENLWKFLRDYKINPEHQRLAYAAVNAILLQPELCTNLTFAQWDLMAEIFYTELTTHDYSADEIAQEAARFYMLKIGSADTNEFITTAIDNNGGVVEKGLEEAYSIFVFAGLESIASATGEHISLTDDNAYAFSARRAQGVILTLSDIASEFCPSTEIMNELIIAAVDGTRPIIADPNSTLSGDMVIFDLLTGPRSANSRRILGDYFAREANALIDAAAAAAAAAIGEGMQSAF